MSELYYKQPKLRVETNTHACFTHIPWLYLSYVWFFSHPPLKTHTHSIMSIRSEHIVGPRNSPLLTYQNCVSNAERSPLIQEHLLWGYRDLLLHTDKSLFTVQKRLSKKSEHGKIKLRQNGNVNSNEFSCCFHSFFILRIQVWKYVYLLSNAADSTN